MSQRTKAITAELEALKDKYGMINAVAAVKWARRNRRSALHGYLEWDDEVAGEKYRVDQIRNFVQVHITDPLGFRRYISLSIDRQASGGYRPVGDVLSRHDLRQVMLDDAIDDLVRLQRLYVSLRELQPVWDCIERLKPKSAA